MTEKPTPLEDVSDACHSAATATSNKSCAFWCARAIAQRATNGMTGSTGEVTYNDLVRQLTPRLLSLVEGAAKFAKKAKK